MRHVRDQQGINAGRSADDEIGIESGGAQGPQHSAPQVHHQHPHVTLILLECHGKQALHHDIECEVNPAVMQEHVRDESPQLCLLLRVVTKDVL